MPKNYLKKLVAAAVLSLVLVPAQFVHALSVVSDPTGQLIDNVANATSMDVSLDIDIETASDQTEQPVVLHFDVDAVSDFEHNASFDAGFSTTDQYGAFYETAGSMIVASDTIYFSGIGGDWYFLESDATATISDEENIADSTEDFKASLQDLFDRGVIAYEAESVQFIDNKLALRYAYEIDNDNLVDYLVEANLIDEAEAVEARAMLADQVTIGGYFWVDTVNLLPVKLTLEVDVIYSETTYTKVDVIVVFNSFEETVDIDEPVGAIDLMEYEPDESQTMVLASLETTVSNMDTDGDGLSDGDEKSLWNTNSFNTDSDADGYSDKTEVINGYNPNGIGKLDSDQDGLVDYNEMTIHWSDRFNADSDGDSYPDGLEIANGYDPNGPGRW